MKRNKSSVVYQYLPHNWVSYSDSSNARGAFSMKVNYWDYKELDGLYNKRLNQQITRKLIIFRNSGGDTSEYGDVANEIIFKYVQVNNREGFAGVLGTISPLVFYCGQCGATKSFSQFPNDSSKLMCTKCHKKMKQLQMIYPCSCGEAKAVFTSNDLKKIYRFKPIANDPKSNYRFTIVENGHEKSQEMVYKCTCGRTLYPYNAFDGRNYKSHSITTVNLIDSKEGKVLEFGVNAEKIQIGRWLHLISTEEYNEILDNPSQFFLSDIDEDEVKKKVKILVQYAEIPEDAARKAIQDRMKSNDSNNWLNEKILEIDNHIQLSSNLSLSQQLIEFFTVKNPIEQLTLDSAIDKMISIDAIYDKSEITSIHKKIGIENVQVSFDIEIVSATYGFTRIYSDPTRLSEGKLKLKAYTQKNETNYIAYSNKLKTEGILFEFDKRKILNWLVDNSIISKSNLPPKNKEKEWFLKMIKSDLIEEFGEIESSDQNKVTKNVYGLLHTISHMMIRAAGELSGLSKDSLSEIIFPNIPAIFIYANTSQAIPLGSLSGLFEMNYKEFLDKAIDIVQSCIFDPLCSNDKGACSGCTYLGEISCSNFNCDLSRFYLIGSPETNGKMIVKGFW